jgi:phosphohistidine phosphatase SixA
MDSESTHRLNRWPWLISGVLVIALVAVWFRCYAWPLEITTIYLVRHAEKEKNAPDPNDPGLSDAGDKRSHTLAHVLKDASIDVIFETQYRRTQLTVKPLVIMAGISTQRYQAGDTQGVANTILSQHTGDRILIVGHSNTIDDIAAALGATGLSDLSEDQFDRLFVIHRFADVVHLDRLRYGVETP